MKNSTRITAAVVSMAFAGAVAAQAPATGTPMPGKDHSSHAMFGTVDMNKDGRISQAEARSHTELQTAFGKLDADGDTYLSQSEFARWDASGKGSKTKPETHSGVDETVETPSVEADPVVE